MVMAAVGVAAVCAAFRLESRLSRHHRRSEAAEQVFDDVIWSDAKRLTPDLSRHVSVSQMPRESHELTGIVVRDVDDGLRRGPNDQPSPVLELQAIAIGHCGRSREMEEDLVALVGDHADTTTMPIVEVEGE
jgi:hypothetical protein